MPGVAPACRGDSHVIVRHWMTTEVVTVRKEASIQEAMALMKTESIRHLPVVDAEKKLVGWVTDADLRGVLIASMLEELTLEDVMIRKPYTCSPDMALEEAARILIERRVGGLPIVKHEKLVGIITVVDILSAFITFLGLFTESSRLDVKASEAGNPLPDITRLVKQHGGEIISICHLPSQIEGKEYAYSIRLKKCDLGPIVADLEAHGMSVTSQIS